MPTKDEIKNSLTALVEAGKGLVGEFMKRLEGRAVRLGAPYQNWYMEALPAVRILAADRYDEFKMYYEGSSPKHPALSIDYGIQHYLRSLSIRNVRDDKFHRNIAVLNITHQINIVSALSGRVDAVLANIEGALFAGLSGAELQTAAKLMKVNLRAAGVVAGVVLETHLQKIASHHAAKSRKKNPGISGWNDALKEADVYTQPDWRRIQRLGDLRNLCCHKNEDEPTKQNVKDLLDGVSWVCANLS